MKLLAQTKDKKDKILNKLYKRRVEMDFSRKTSRSGVKALAATLTACTLCGKMFLEGFGHVLTCNTAEVAVNFRGQLARRHTAAVDWSLTSYLKLLHAGGMSWESIYWFVWSSCVVIAKDGVYFSVNEYSRYKIDDDAILIYPRYADVHFVDLNAHGSM